MKIRDFGVEMWMNAYENNCTYNLAETCVKSLTVQELAALSGKGDKVWEDIRAMQLTYGDIEGSMALREGLCGPKTPPSRTGPLARTTLSSTPW